MGPGDPAHQQDSALASTPHHGPLTTVMFSPCPHACGCLSVSFVGAVISWGCNPSNHTLPPCQHIREKGVKDRWMDDGRMMKGWISFTCTTDVNTWCAVSSLKKSLKFLCSGQLIFFRTAGSGGETNPERKSMRMREQQWCLWGGPTSASRQETMRRASQNLLIQTAAEWRPFLHLRTPPRSGGSALHRRWAWSPVCDLETAIEMMLRVCVPVSRLTTSPTSTTVVELWALYHM